MLKTEDLMKFIRKFRLDKIAYDIELSDRSIEFVVETGERWPTEYILYQSGRYEILTFRDRNDGTGNIDPVILAEGNADDLKIINVQPIFDNDNKEGANVNGK